MLTHVKVGRAPEPNTLVLTPEFFETIKEINQSCGVYLRTRLYPLVRNWLVVSDIPARETTPVAEFTVKVRDESLSIFIPIKQCDIFDGKVIGRALDIVKKPLGFLGP